MIVAVLFVSALVGLAIIMIVLWGAFNAVFRVNRFVWRQFADNRKVTEDGKWTPQVKKAH